MYVFTSRWAGYWENTFEMIYVSYICQNVTDRTFSTWDFYLMSVKLRILQQNPWYLLVALNRTRRSQFEHGILYLPFHNFGFQVAVLNCSIVMQNIVSDSAYLSKVVHPVYTYDYIRSSQFTELFSVGSYSGNSHLLLIFVHWEPDEQFHFIVIFWFVHSRFSLCICRLNS